MKERILICGAGIAGLSAAMALSRGDRDVTVIDRDPPPPELGPDEAFESWERKGVTQLRHSHVFLGRLIKLIRDRHPALWTALLEAGAREFTFADGLSPLMRGRYRYVAGDEDMSFLFSRRTTLELVMRRYAATLPGVTFVTGAGLHGAIVENGTVAGVIAEIDGVRREIRADSIVDATGRNTTFPEWLGLDGTIADTSPAGILYFTRHYRLLDGAAEPERDGPPGAGDLGYIKFGVFPADNGHFSITLAVPEIETGLRTAMLGPEVFDATCRAIPGTARWIDPARAEPASKVFGMGNLHSVWRRYAPEGTPRIRHYYPIGDAALRTNPLYGRGCSTGAIQAHLLAKVMDEVADPALRLAELERRSIAEIRPYYDVMVKQDAQAIRRAVNEQAPGYKPRFKARMVKSLLEDAIGPASRGNLAMMRAMMRAFHMLDDPTGWIKRPINLWRIARTWATPRRFKKHLYEPVFGPGRAEMLRQLGISAPA